MHLSSCLAQHSDFPYASHSLLDFKGISNYKDNKFQGPSTPMTFVLPQC